MERLIHARLFGDGLIPVETPQMVRRYNDALAGLGVAPTTLESFRVDGVGWSPEIADERSDPLYLSHGIANQIGIVLSPDQENKPIYFPFGSFDRALMRLWFRRFRERIADVTRGAPIQLEFDEGMTAYAAPCDLLLVESFVVRSTAGRQLDSVREQQALVARFLDYPDAWLDPQLRARILESAREHGDLRGRSVGIPDLVFDDVRDFHIRAFGGVFVFRSQGPGATLVLEDPRQPPASDEPGRTTFTLDTSSVLDHLHARGFLTIDLEWYRGAIGRLEHMHECLVASFLCEDDPELRFDAMTRAQRTARLCERAASAPDVIFELERLIARLRAPEGRAGDLSRELQLVLLRPTDPLAPSSRGVVWRLVSAFQPWNVHRLYIYARERFFDLYRGWPDSKREWAVSLIRNRYRRLMDE